MKAASMGVLSITKMQQMFAVVCSAVLISLAILFYSVYNNDMKHYPKDHWMHSGQSQHITNSSKPFAYYVLTEKCLAPYLYESVALGNSSRCDVFVNSFKAKCDDQNIPPHITYLFDDTTTWSAGRNLLYYHVKSTGKQYFYHIFMDDDVIPVYTEHLIKFRNTEMKGNEYADISVPYLKSEKGLKDAIYIIKDGKSAWRQFEDDLLFESPAFAVTNYVVYNVESRLLIKRQWKEVCAKGKEMPWIVPTFYLDELFIAFHQEALPVMLPYTTMFEKLSWHISGMIHIFRGRALLYRMGMADYKVAVINGKHRDYPKGGPPGNMLADYLAADGKDMKGLIDERDLDWSNYDTWQKWIQKFMHRKAICMKPIKFPVSRHYTRHSP